MGKGITVASQEQQPEIFYTLQGEGRNIGQPTTFLRVSECNLQCTWCDTPYTWNFEDTPYEHEDNNKYSRNNQQLKLTVGETQNILTKEKSQHVVITGGEPMLQQKQLMELIQGCRNEDPSYKFDIETNGTVMPTDDIAEAVNLFTVSPKLENSGNSEKRYRPAVIDKFSKMSNADFKFVVQGIGDLSEIFKMIKAHNIPKERVFLMPEGRTQDELAKTSGWVAEIAKEYQFNFTSRLHIDLWGDKRGV